MKTDKNIEKSTQNLQVETNQTISKKQSAIMTFFSYKPVLYFFFFVAIFVAFVMTKDYIFSIIANNDHKKIVHKGTTKITIENSGFSHNVTLDKQKATKLIKSKLSKIEQFKAQENQKFNQELKSIINRNFQSSYQNIPLYADWFYGYTTQYKILYTGAKGIINNYRAGLSDYQLLDATMIQINNYIATHYKNIVLKPHLIEPLLKNDISNLISQYVMRKNQFIKQIHDEFKTYLTKNPDKLSNSVLKDIQANWESNIKNAQNLLSYKDKSGEGGLTIGAVSLIGAKLAQGACSKALASKIIAKAGIKKAVTSMGAKVAAAPFSAGMSLAIGFLADFGLNKLDEVSNRDAFEYDVKVSLDNIQTDILSQLQRENIVLNIYDSDINLFKNFINSL